MQESLRFPRPSSTCGGFRLLVVRLRPRLVARCRRAPGVLLALAGDQVENLWPLLRTWPSRCVWPRGVGSGLSANLELSISLVPSLFAAVTFGPLEAMLIGAASLLGDLRRPYMKWAVYTPVGESRAAISGLAALDGAVVVSCSLPAIALATCVCRVRRTRPRYRLRLLHGRLARHRQTAVELTKTLAPGDCPSGPPLYPDRRAPLVRLRCDLALDAAVVPRPGDRRPTPLRALSRTSVAWPTIFREVNQRLERANISFATALVATLDARDQYTAGHSAAVAIYSRDIARRMALVRRGATEGSPLRTRARHRQDWAPRRPSREAGRIEPRRAPPDAGTLRDWREDPCEGRGLR